jgi:hypothetical protein
MDTRMRSVELALDLISPPPSVKSEVIGLLEASERWYKHEGLQGINRSKQYFNIALDIFLGQPYESPSWIKMDKQNSYPTLIKRTIKWGLEHPKDALTLLRIHELFVNDPTDDDCLKAMETITSPSTADGNPEYTNAILDEAKRYSVSKLNVSLGSVPMFTKGPNGSSILSGHKDSKAHAHYGSTERMLTFTDEVASHGKISTKMSSSMREMLLTDFGKYSGEQLGRVVFLSEKSGKLRVIAQGDYITQSSMKPIHDTINEILKRITGDYTFDQGAGKRWARNQTKSSKWMASYDMSAATDRLPAWLQAKIVDVVLPGNLGASWLDLLVNRDFAYKLPSGRTGTVRYTVGQPMGFYSSFASFALLHHLVVRAAYRLAHKGKNLPTRQFYAIIGDDMCINDRAVGEMYVKIITSIGGIINLGKSRLSKVPGVTICEFAKAWSINGTDITPSSLRALKSALNSWTNVPQAIASLEKDLRKKIKAKKMKFILQKYWPNEANTLMRLITVPQKLGGFGKPDSNPLVDAISGENGNAVRAFIANKMYTVFNQITTIDDSDIGRSISDDIDPRLQRLALTPLLRLLKDTEELVKIPYVVTSRSSFLRWITDEGTSLRTLLDWYDKLVINLPIAMREQLDRPSLGWIRALEDDKKLPPSSDSDVSLHYAALELMDDNKSRR